MKPKILICIAIYFLECIVPSETSVIMKRSVLDFFDDGQLSGITFSLYDRNHSEIALKLANCEALIHDKNTIFLVHGWNENGLTPWYKEIVNEYLKRGDYQIVAVDWQLMAAEAYHKSVVNTRKVGFYIGTQIVKLMDIKGFCPRHFHLIGFSLGAHVAGFIGKTIIKKSGCKVGRITGIDPAGPLFELVPPVERLDEGDAEWVEVMHCNAGMAGIRKTIGTRDFYVNGGSNQPMCVERNLKNPFTSFDLNQLACSHRNCPLYFAKTINHPYIGHKCSDKFLYDSGLCRSQPEATFGIWKGNDSHGRYYMKM